MADKLPSVWHYHWTAWLTHWRDAILWDPVAAFTIVLGFSTVGLWLATRRLWRGAEAQANDVRRSANAAEAAASASKASIDLTISQREASERAREKGVAYELVAIIAEVVNHLRLLEQHFREQVRTTKVTQGAEVVAEYMLMNPLMGLSDEGSARLPSGTTELLVKAGAVDLWNKLRLLVARNRSLTSNMREYRDLWDVYLAKLPVPEGFTGDVGHFQGPAGTFAQLRPDFVRLDSAVRALKEQVEETSPLVTEVSHAIGPLFKSYFNEPFLHVEEATEDQAAGRA